MGWKKFVKSKYKKEYTNRARNSTQRICPKCKSYKLISVREVFAILLFRIRITKSYIFLLIIWVYLHKILNLEQAD